MKKRFLALLLGASMLASMTGCTQSQPTANQTTADAVQTGDEQPGAAAGLFKPGTYQAEANGMNGPVKVEVAVDAESILSVKILDHAETKGISDPAIERMPQAIVDGQSIAVDTVSGATITSGAILAAVKTALLDAGAAEDAISKAVEKKTQASGTIERTADVVIIGSGGAGMSAALEAIKAGGNVIVIEKMASAGGNTILAGSAMNAADPEQQKKQEMTSAQLDTIDSLLELPAKNDHMKAWQDAIRSDIETYRAENDTCLYDSPALHKLQTYVDGDYVANPALVEVFGDNALEGIHWLTELGTEWSDTITAAVGATWTRSHTPLQTFGSKGAGFVLPQLQEVEKLGGEILLEHTAQELLTENGRVVGVKGVTADGSEFIFKAEKGVILATGGFSANVEMREKYNTHWATLDESIPTSNGPQATGDGIIMAEAIGANLVGMEWIQMLPTTMKSFTPAIDSTILVNKEGKRFVKEDGRRDEISKATLEQPETKYWRIVDAHVTEDMLNGVAYTGEVIDEMVDNKGVFKADSLAELADMIGVPADELQNTVDEFNGFVESNGKGDPTGRTLFDQKIDKAPYYALVGLTKVHHTMGGVEINADTQVIDKDGNVIEGLFAAGEVTGGIHGSNRLGGNAISDAIVFGRLAGINVMK